MIGERHFSSLSREDNWIQLLIIGAFTLLPLSGRGNILKLILALLFFLHTLTRGHVRPGLTKVFVPMLLGLLIAPLAVLICEQRLSGSDVIHEAERLLFYILIIQCCWNSEVKFDSLYRIATALFIIHLAIQLLQYSGFQPIFNIIEKYYLQPGDSGIHLSLARSKNLLNFRSGSIFMNPNVYMVIPCVYLSIAYQKLLNRRSLAGYILVVCAAVSLLLTGSRTSIVVFFIVSYIYLKHDKSIGGFRWIIIFLLAIMASWTIIFSSLSNKYRAFDIASGVDNSFGVKLKILWRYITTSNPLYFLTGSLGKVDRTLLDFEVGYLFSFFGPVGFIWYVRFLKLIGRSRPDNSFLTRSATLIIILIGLTATVILCMPVFPYVCMLVLPQKHSFERGADNYFT